MVPFLMAGRILSGIMVYIFSRMLYYTNVDIIINLRDCYASAVFLYMSDVGSVVLCTINLL